MPWAKAGSRLQMQLYVNRYRDELDEAIRNSLSFELRARKPTIEWRYPLEEDDFAVPCGDAALMALDLLQHLPLMEEFQPRWPFQWDAAAVITLGRPNSRHLRWVLLVTAQSCPGERNSSAAAREWLGASAKAVWPEGPSEYANRLEQLYFFNEYAPQHGVDNCPAWLANVYFVDDETVCPTTREEWDAGIERSHAALGVEAENSPLRRYAGGVALPGKSRTW